jgi:hypothetical protein
MHSRDDFVDYLCQTRWPPAPARTFARVVGYVFAYYTIYIN